MEDDTKKRIAIFSIFTGNYSVFYQQFVKSIAFDFLPEHDKHFFICTDRKLPNYNCVKGKVTQYFIDELPWPMNSLNRYDYYKDLINKDAENYDYVFFINSNIHCVTQITINDINLEKDFTFVLHDKHINKECIDKPFERNEISCACLSDKWKRNDYVGAGLFGAKPNKFLEVSEILSTNIKNDLNENYIAVWHDESHLNYFLNTTEILDFNLLNESYYHGDKINRVSKKHKRYQGMFHATKRTYEDIKNVAGFSCDTNEKKLFEKYMIVYEPSKERCENFTNTSQLVKNLDKFPAADTINHFDKFEVLAKSKNYVTEIYTQGYLCQKFKGKLGCNVSHQMLWDHFLETSDLQWLVVFEDDIHVESYDCDNRFFKILSRANDNASEFVQLYTNPGFLNEQSKRENLGGSLHKMLPQWHTIAYAITKKGIEICKSLYPMNENIDVWLSSKIKELNASCWINDLFHNKGDLIETEPTIINGRKVWIRTQTDAENLGSIIWNE